MKLDVFCDICGYKIAKIDTENIEFPMKGKMFESPYPAYKIPPPFYPDAEFIYMKCPICRNRPFFSDRLILTNLGKLDLKTGKLKKKYPEPVIQIYEDEELEREWEERQKAFRAKKQGKVFKCDKCGLEFASEDALKYHKTTSQGLKRNGRKQSKGKRKSRR